MPLPHILYPPPGEDGMRSWVFAHWQDHLEIVGAINRKLGTNLQVYVIDPLPMTDMRSWLQRHQYYHNDMNGLFQIQGSDLQGLDLKDPEIVRQWMFENFQEHQAVRAVLGI
jgi:hypothetical protein